MNEALAAWAGVAFMAVGGIVGMMKWVAGLFSKAVKQADDALSESREALTETDERNAEAAERRDREQTQARHNQANQMQGAMGELRREMRDEMTKLDVRWTTVINRLEDKLREEIRRAP